MLEFDKYEVLTFDCYGTLIDWENGILDAIRPLFAAHSVHMDDGKILALYAEFESMLEASAPIKYKNVLRGVAQKFGEQLGFSPTESEVDAFANSIKTWRPFPDTVAALKRLKDRYKLAIISNVDDGLFVFSAHQLQVEFDWIITAEQAGSYKPSMNNFNLAMQRMGIPPEKILHVGASIYHDIIPANALGFTTVWINRKANALGEATYWARSQENLPDDQPDIQVHDLETLAKLSAESSKS